MDTNLISIIIPVFHDWKRLSKCLDALSNQTLVREKFEIIVINNNPKDKPPDYFQLPPHAILIHEKKQGSYAARNKGIEKANGSILAFTDSDCIPSKKWLENALNHFQKNNELKRLSGKIELFFRDKSNLTASELFEKEFAFKQDMYVKDGTAATANLFCRKDVFNEVGLFDESLFSGGDFEWNFRANRKGYEIRYADDVIVYHPARSSLSEIWKKAVRIYKGTYKVKKYSEEGLFFNLLYGVYMLRPKISVIKRLGKKYSFSSIIKIMTVKLIYDFAQMITHYKLIFNRNFLTN